MQRISGHFFFIKQAIRANGHPFHKPVLLPDIDPNHQYCHTLLNETPPRFKQGIPALAKILKDSIRYPLTAIQDGVGGTVEVGFVLDTSGNIRDVHILKSVRDDIDREAARVIQFISTGWEPGIQNDKKVEVKFHMPIKFSPPTGKHKKRYLRKHHPGYLDR
ncbi:energy transducer TonB [Chitinophaga sp. XS-30]|nr:energy transducer TonB [Chitinophaga sp. XS-30]